MDRRDFLRLSGVGLGTVAIPILGRPVPVGTSPAPMAAAHKKTLADVALNTAKTLGATYADLRIARQRNQFVVTREDRVQSITNTESFGVGVRVIVGGTWGFAATSAVNADEIARATRQAIAVARANAAIQKEPVILAPVKGVGEVSWATPILKNAFDVPVDEKVDLLMAVNKAAQDAGANFVNSMLYLVNEQKYFASTDGSYIDQDVHRIWPNFTVTGIDKESGGFQTRNGFGSPMGMGWEYLAGKKEDKIESATVLYKNSYDMVEDARLAGAQVHEKIAAKSVQAGKYDLVLDPTHLGLTIHESVGHATELDRVLGYEANFAGTSFATLDKWKSKKFNYGSEIVNFYADKTEERSLGAAGYDDEGVKTKRWPIVKDGILVGYQAIRDQCHILGEKESHGCCYADSWSSVQFQRMPNVSLQPSSTEPGEAELTPQDMIAGVEKGIYILGRGSYSIDQQRYNFQFGGQLFYEIKEGKIAGMLRDVTYQSNTQEFWNSCTQICGKDDYRLFGSFFDGKGQPMQVSAVSHGSATTRFDGVNVINSSRKIS